MYVDLAEIERSFLPIENYLPFEKPFMILETNIKSKRTFSFQGIRHHIMQSFLIALIYLVLFMLLFFRLSQYYFTGVDSRPDNSILNVVLQATRTDT